MRAGPGSEAAVRRAIERVTRGRALIRGAMAIRDVVTVQALLLADRTAAEDVAGSEVASVLARELESRGLPARVVSVTVQVEPSCPAAPAPEPDELSFSATSAAVGAPLSNGIDIHIHILND